MNAAVLLDDAATVDGHHLTVGEGRLDEADGSLVVLWLVVCRNEYRTIYDKVVGIGGRQLGAVLIQYGVG